MTELTDATFYAPLTSSGTPTNGTGTFTFTRATAKKVINSAGVLESVTSGNISFNANYGAHIDPASKTNNLLYCRDLTKSNLYPETVYWQSNTQSGSNLVTNGGFDSDTVWIKGAGVTISGGVAHFIGVPVFNNSLYQSCLPSNKFITCTFTVSNHIAGGVRLNNGTTSYSVTGNGTYTLSFYNAANANLIFKVSGVNGTFDLDNVSVYVSGAQPTLTGTGVDGLANSCSVLTAVAANSIILQTITAAATAACSGFWVKRSVGTGSIYITRDGGANWTDITSLINSSTFTCVKIENTSVTNPQVGFKIATSGDAIIVDAGLNHAGTQLCEPILTTTAAVTRNAEVLTYQTSGNFSDTAGTVLATFRPTYDTWPAGSIVGKASFGLLASAANSGVQAADGTNTVSGLSGAPTGQRKIGARWSGSSLQAFYQDEFGAIGSYDGSFNLSTIAINSGAAGYIRDLAIFNSSLVDADISSAWGLIVIPPDLTPGFFGIPVSLAVTNISIDYSVINTQVSLAQTDIEVSG